MANPSLSSLTVPVGFTLHTENTSRILLPSNNEAFLNPVQEFNRDLSVAVIRVWSEELDRIKEDRWRQARERRLAKAEKQSVDRKRRKVEEGDVQKTASVQPDEVGTQTEGPVAISDAVTQTKEAEYRPHKFVILEALSATGLRSIRYAKEIPLVRYVIANDLSPLATAAMTRNVELNGLGGTATDGNCPDADSDATRRPEGKGKVRVNEGDARILMYSHAPERNRVDVVDLDPYGTAAPFIDAGVQCVVDGGLLCVTCTDLSVLATNNYPEKCYSNYGGVSVKAEYSHEAALRLVLHTIATSAARYGRYIEPLLCLSIDFYVRMFVKVQTAPIQVKKVASQTSVYYVCSGCQSFHEQPFGRMTEKVNDRGGKANILFKTHVGPPVPEKCPECGSPLHIAGPMWNGRIHDPQFVGRVLEHLECSEDNYGTSARMKGMLTVAKEELAVPFYFTPSRVASFFHCTCPSLDEIASALLHAGHQVSRSHAAPGSLKTTATRRDLHDVYRCWVKTHPVKVEKIPPNSPARVLLQKEPSFEADFASHPLTVSQSSKVKLVRYQPNPAPNWGPATRADSGVKRKRRDRDE
ncbi:N2 N2-dimethylguanosine tRNA methyltransferase [Russula earlei]|uniref:N2 N2-dimethylguanosine tRNA methyltransferase n=1 Tax=Russula earlei TaxID=71964 RepID=A0ACC0UEU6_9AGAM|nr:N2 N2-dimethylguanosine tRNA methyltransferase [Russula earlei]